MNAKQQRASPLASMQTDKTTENLSNCVFGCSPLNIIFKLNWTISQMLNKLLLWRQRLVLCEWISVIAKRQKQITIGASNVINKVNHFCRDFDQFWKIYICVKKNHTSKLFISLCKEVATKISIWIKFSGALFGFNDFMHSLTLIIYIERINANQ